MIDQTEAVNEGGHTRGHSQSAKPFTKRARENSNEYKDVGKTILRQLSMS